MVDVDVSLYIRVNCNFFTHRKTIRLRAAIGNDAFWIPPRLWAYAAEHQEDGNFSNYSDAEIAIAIGYSGEPSSLIKNLTKAGFLDSDRQIHAWAEYNGYHKAFRERALKAVQAREEKRREESTREEARSSSRSSSRSSCDTARALSESLCEMFLRQNRRLTYAEESELAEISRREGVFGELAELKAFKPLAGKYFPNSMSRLLASWDATLDRARQESAHQQTKNNTKPLSVMDLKSIIATKEERMSKLRFEHYTDGPLGGSWDNDEARAQHKTLREEIKQLKTKIESMA